VALFVVLAYSPIAAAAPSQPGEIVNQIQQPSACELCHDFLNPIDMIEDLAIAPMKTWQGSMMANSARDPVFWAGVAVASQDIPGATELCVRCHAPSAFLDGAGASTALDELTLDQQHGVECEFCHRMVDDGETPPGNAQYTIDDVLVNAQVPRRGQWDFSDGNPEPPHEWIQDPYIGSSRFCGTCHDVTTPVERVDDDGVGMGMNFNEQRTYSEWLNSDFADGEASAKSCPDCHMPEVPDMAACVENQNQFSHETGGRRHDLVGANRFMVELLKQEYGSAGANQIANTYYNFTLDAMDEFVKTAATLELSAPDDVDLSAGLDGLAVVVTNNSGHKLPSGYSEGRIMWLEVQASYDDQVIYSSGTWDQAAGEIEQDGQLHTYEAIGEEYATGTTFHLLLNNHWAHDDRIPPKGLKPDVETDPVGDRYTLQMDGTWPNFDTHSYSFDPAPEVFDVTPAENADDLLTVTVKLQYLINTPEYIDFLGENGSSAGMHIASLFAAAGGATPVTFAEQTLEIPITGFGSVGPSDETGSESSMGGESSTNGEGESSTESEASTSTQDEVGTGDTSAQDDGGSACNCSNEGRGSFSPLLVLFGVGALRRRRARSRSLLA
jgi:uncharacterized protein (TIGR03382 family)